MNTKWHQQNRMPRQATVEQRLAWHRAHQEHCGCRPAPKGLLGLGARPRAGTSRVQPLPAQGLLSFFQLLEPRMVQWLTKLINTDTPSDQKQPLDRLATWFAGQLRSCGAQTQILQNQEAGNHLLARWTGAGARRKPILILGHLDTVWGLGESQRRPARIENRKLFGPGAFDMRGGLTLVLALAKYLATHPSELGRPVTILLDSDEEVGSLTSRPLIEAEAQRSEAVLVVEPCLPGGALKTFRKGVGRFTISAQGVAAHAGVDYSKGVSAIQELAHQVLAVYKLNDPAKGTTVNVGVIRGGSRSNVVASQAEMEVDVRIAAAAEGERLTALLRGLKPKNRGASLQISGGINRPPMERTAKIVDLFHRASALAAQIGIELAQGETGGGSDGCFTAALGIPTLDGLGPDGAGPHALHEHVLIESLVPRAALLTQLVLKL
ncbi:MAG: M20 family metallopeptidase [Acidobacteria bacterium]|nr:M20 family metallopeptidase [Acidobacteriota bacterium]